MTETVKLHFVDTETTGLIDKNPDAEITEIACVTWQDGNIETLLHERVKPKKPFDLAEVQKYNKSYDPALWADAEGWDVHSSKHVAGLFEGVLFAGSNPEFDKRMIEVECFRTGQPRPGWHHRMMNTCALGMPLWIMGETNGSGLGHLTEYFGIKHEAHTALGDCLAAIKVWEAFFDIYIYRPRELEKTMRHFSSTPMGREEVQERATKVLAELDAAF